LNTWEGEGVPPQPHGYAGLFHFALVYSNRKQLAQTVQTLRDAGYPIDGASDHGVSEAIYLTDMDGIGVELYFDRPKSEWEYEVDGSIRMYTKPLDMKSLMAEL
jgi:catechol 2,3-dioxygenase